MVVVHGACAPVADFLGGDFERGDIHRLAPAQLADAMEAQVANQVGGVMGGDHGGALGKSAERWAIEMIEMGVGDKDQIDWRKLADVEGRSEQAGGSAGPQAQADANAVGEDWIG